MPSTDGGDDFVGICGLSNGLENGDLIFEGAAPGGLEVGDRAGEGARQTCFCGALRSLTGGSEPIQVGEGEELMDKIETSTRINRANIIALALISTIAACWFWFVSQIA